MLALKVILLFFFERRLSRLRHIVQRFLRLGQAGEIDIEPDLFASLNDVLFGIPRSIDLALVGVHVAVEPDFQITFLGFGLAEMDEFLNGHVGTVARIVLSRKFPAELQVALLVKTEVIHPDLPEVERGRPLAIRNGIVLEGYVDVSERLEDLAEVAVLEENIAIDVGVAHDRRREQVRVLGGTDFIEWEPLERREATEVFPSAEVQGFRFDPFAFRLACEFVSELCGCQRKADFGASTRVGAVGLEGRTLECRASTATHVSEVNPLSTKVNADIWVSGDTAQFAIGCLKVDAQYHSSSCFVPSSLQLLKPAEVEKKSRAQRLPITAMLSKEASAKSYDTLLYVDRDLLEQSQANLGFIIRSFGNTDELKKAYPSIMDEVLGLSPNEEMSIDELAEDKTALAKELNRLNRQREQFNVSPSSPAAKKSR